MQRTQGLAAAVLGDSAVRLLPNELMGGPGDISWLQCITGLGSKSAWIKCRLHSGWQLLEWGGVGGCG